MGIFKDQPLTIVFFAVSLALTIKYIIQSYSQDLCILIFLLVISTYLIGHYHGEKEVKK